MPEEQLTTLARALTLAGGVILLVAGILELVGNNNNLFTYVNSPLLVSPIQEGVLAIAAGVLALAGYRQLQTMAWSLLLIVLGIVTGGLGGILILVSGLVSLVVAHAEKAVGPQRQA